VTKKRVYEIAKEWGMTGQDLAAELRGWGKTHVKTHMTALDDSEVMEIEGRLEAYGRKRTAGSDSDADAGAPGDLAGVIRRKKKFGDDGLPTPSYTSAPAAEVPGIRRKKKVEDTPEVTPRAPAGSAPRSAAPAGSPATAPGAASTGAAARPPSAPLPAGAAARTSSAPPARRPGADAPAADNAAKSGAAKDAGAPATRAPVAAQPSGAGTTPAPSRPRAGEADDRIPRAPATPAAAASGSQAVAQGPSASAAAAPARPAALSTTQSSAAQPSTTQPSAAQSSAAAAANESATVSSATVSSAQAAAQSTPAQSTAPKPTAPATPAGAGAASKIAGPPTPQPAGAARAGDADAKKAAASAGDPSTAAGAAAQVSGAAAQADGAAAQANSPSKIQGTASEIVRPGAARRAGKVVGFVDLSKLAPPPTPVKRDSRRLRSADDEAAPNVQPTLGKDRRKAFTRGADAQRSTLSPQELREREAGRVLRTSGPTRGGSGGRSSFGGRGTGGRGGTGRSGRPLGSGSPYQGQVIQVEAPVTVKQLAESIALKANDVLRKAFSLLGFGAVNINTTLDEDTAVLLAGEFGVELEVTQAIAAEDALLAGLAAKRSKVEEESLMLRPPTVAVLGHVDHGKTTLIDTIRRSQITHGESGGITQHIGAYQVTTKLGHKVTIIDTPGHAAFTAMRARGARAVDIVILVVAADDGVMPQTEEAINHARVAKVPIVVAINKMDRPEANPERVMNELAAKELIPEEWGGPTAMLKVSALKGDGIEDLLERVFLESEVLELKAHPKGPAMGVVLEAEMQEGRGKIAHLLIQDGSLKRGDVILAGEGYGKVRSLQNDRGETLEEAGPSMPVEVTGLSELPTIGERFYVVESLDAAQEVALERARANRMLSLVDRKTVNRENLFQVVAASHKKSVNLVVRADVQGSLEVLKAQLAGMLHDEVEVKIIDSGVGAVTESNVDLAISSDATIMAFHVGTNPKARQNAERGGVEIRNYTVLYEMLNDVTKMMEGTLSPEIIEEITGHVEIRRLFKSSKIGNIAGSHVIDGKVSRDSKIRLLRDGTVVWTGQMGSLRREKDETKDVREGFDCGIVLKNYDDIREGDILEAFRLIERKRKI